MTNHDLKKKLAQCKGKVNPDDWKSRLEKTYKEDSTGNFDPLATNKLEVTPQNKDQLKILKRHSVDDRKRLKVLKSLQSMKIKDPNLFIEDQILNISLEAGRNLDSILNKTLSMVWQTQWNMCTSPIENFVNRDPHHKWDKITVPIKLTIEKNYTSFEISFEYNLSKDTPSGVAEELKDSVKLSDKHTKKVAMQIKKVVDQIESLIDLVKMIKKRDQEFAYSKLKHEDAILKDKNLESNFILNGDLYNSYNESLYEKLQIFKRDKKLDLSFLKVNKKLIPKKFSTARR